MQIANMNDSILGRLMTWFASQCDGTWEHQKGISIETTDNPGWWVKIDIQRQLSGLPDFQRFSLGTQSSDDWIVAYVEEGVFNGAGSPSNLGKVLTIFLCWVDGDAAGGGIAK